MIEDKVMGIIAENTSVDRSAITLDSTFEELNLDSMDAINVVFELEEKFQITIPDEAARQVRTVRQVVDEVSRLIAIPKESPSAGVAVSARQPAGISSNQAGVIEE